MSGRLFCILGPSGSGKDSLLNELRGRAPHIKIVKRYITRPTGNDDEDHYYLCPQSFDRHITEGEFLFTWRAHGLSYGIPISCLDYVRAGQDVVFNGSRTALEEMKLIFPDLQVIWISVSIEILAGRLRQRGREPEQQILERLNRKGPKPPKNAIIINNDGTIDQAAEALSACFRYPAAHVQSE